MSNQYTTTAATYSTRRTNLLAFLVSPTNELKKKNNRLTLVFSNPEGEPIARTDSKGDESKSIGDYVMGLHGNKYQFDNPSTEMAPGMSYTGSQFAEALYGGGENEMNYAADIDEEEELPNWAKRIEPPSVVDNVQFLDLNAVGGNGNERTVSIKVTNQERTWEKFYARTMRRRGDDFIIDGSDINCSFYVQPKAGQLAPRGRDESSAFVYIRCKPGLAMPLDADRINEEDWWLVVATEEEQWNYRLRIPKQS